MVKLYTSHPAVLRRQALSNEVGNQYLAACIDSWSNAGFEIISVNDPDEIASLEALDLGIQYVPGRSGRPTIADFLALIRESGDPISGIVNADCMFLGTDATAARICETAAHDLVMLERLNISPVDLRPTGLSCSGFDAFLFPASRLGHVKMQESLRIGDSWWDYWLPFAFSRSGIGLVQSKAPLLSHLDHPVAWKKAQYLTAGRAFCAEFRDAPSFGLDEMPVQDISEFMVGAVAGLAFDLLRTNARKIDFLTSDRAEETRGAFLSGLAFARSFTEQHLASIAEIEDGCLAVRKYMARSGSKRRGEFYCTIANIAKSIGLPNKERYMGMHKVGAELQYLASPAFFELRKSLECDLKWGDCIVDRRKALRCEFANEADPLQLTSSMKAARREPSTALAARSDLETS